MKQPIGFIGLGMMGLPMARNLLKNGYQVTVYNRTKDKAAELVQAGARLVDKPVDVLSDGCVVITMVSNDKVLEELVSGKGGIGEGLKPGHIHLSMSTVGPDTSRQLTEYHKQKGAAYLAAPVSGRPIGAATQKLWIFLAGESKAKQAVKPILDTLGQRTFDVSEVPSDANIVKLCGNVLLSNCIEVLAEITAVAEKNGLPKGLVGQIFSESLFACPAYQIYAPIINNREFNTGAFKLSLGLKDINLFLKTAEEVRQPVPLVSLVQEHMLEQVEKGRSDWDWSSLALSSLEPE